MDDLVSLKHVSKAFRRALRNLLGAKPAAPDDRHRGDAARDEKRWLDAASAYRGHLDKHPGDFAIWVQLGHMLKEGGQRVDAALAYEAAFAIDPADADLLLSKGHLARLSGELDRAARDYLASYLRDGNDAARHHLNVADMVEHVERAVAALGKKPLIGTASSTGVGAIDPIHGWALSGWAIDPKAPAEPATVDIFANGVLVETLRCDRFRVEALRGHGATTYGGFDSLLPVDLSGPEPVVITVRLANGGPELVGSGVAITAPPELQQWLLRSRIPGDARNEVIARTEAAAAGKTLSIVMPVYNSDPAWLAEALDSVIAQWCGRWELLCVDDCSSRPEPREILSDYARRDPRIKPIFLPKNGGISVAVNAGLAAVAGDYVGFLDHDDVLEPDAVAEMLYWAIESDADLLYSDEAVTGASIHAIRSIAARPAFSHDYYLSHPYFVHFVCVKAALARDVGYDEAMSISADVDFVLRVIARAERIAHVPAILYRWRTHDESTGHTRQDGVTEATLGALNRHLASIGRAAHAAPGLHFNNFTIDHDGPGGKVAIVIPTKNRHDLVKACIDSIRRTTRPDDVEIVVVDHDSTDPASRAYFSSIANECHVIPYLGPFNFSAINNFAVAQLGDHIDYVLFCNNDIEAIEPGWLEHMRGIAARPDVGVVGATLLYPDRSIQHAGVIVPLRPLADHAHRLVPFESGGARNPGYNGSLTALRDYSAVTAACMMMRRALFVDAGGFDRTFEIGFNDTDLCLRVGALGYKILNDPRAVLFHHESATRSQTDQVDHPEDSALLMARWIGPRADGDPFYSPLLSPNAGDDHRPAVLEHFWQPARVRAVRPSLGAPELARPERYR